MVHFTDHRNRIVWSCKVEDEKKNRKTKNSGVTREHTAVNTMTQISDGASTILDMKTANEDI